MGNDKLVEEILKEAKSETLLAEMCVRNEATDTKGITEAEITANLRNHLEDYAREIIKLALEKCHSLNMEWADYNEGYQKAKADILDKLDIILPPCTCESDTRVSSTCKTELLDGVWSGHLNKELRKELKK